MITILFLKLNSVHSFGINFEFLLNTFLHCLINLSPGINHLLLINFHTFLEDYEYRGVYNNL